MKVYLAGNVQIYEMYEMNRNRAEASIYSTKDRAIFIMCKRGITGGKTRILLFFSFIFIFRSYNYASVFNNTPLHRSG